MTNICSICGSITKNLGDVLLTKDHEYAAWFINDMDSIMTLMANEFKEHRKLKGSFKYHYRRKMASPLKNLKNEIEQNNWKSALDTYSVLTENCNDCHIDHDIDKEVRDVTWQ